MYISQIINFNKEHSKMPIYKTLEKRWILNILRKEFIFLYSKTKTFFRRIAVFTSLGVLIFWVTLRNCAQIFLKKTTIYKNDASICFNFLYTDQAWRVKRMWLRYILFVTIFVNDYQARFLAKFYLIKLNNRNIRKTCETCSKLTIKAAEQC